VTRNDRPLVCFFFNQHEYSRPNIPCRLKYVNTSGRGVLARGTNVYLNLL
jgi:hypothetical protein